MCIQNSSNVNNQDLSCEHDRWMNRFGDDPNKRNFKQEEFESNLDLCVNHICNDASKVQNKFGTYKTIP